MAEPGRLSAEQLDEIRRGSISFGTTVEPGLPQTFDVEMPGMATPETVSTAPPEKVSGGRLTSEQLAEIARGSLPKETFITPTGGEIATEIGLGAIQGTKQGITVGYPAVYGARAGAAVGAPFFPPYGAVVGGTLGFLGGLTAGALTDQQLDDLFPLPSREDLAPYREGAKTTFSIIGGAGAITKANIPTTSKNFLARHLSGIEQFARKNPRAFYTAEGVQGLGAGVGGGMAVAYDPESPWTRFFAELAGGVIANPASFVVAQTGKATGFLTDFTAAFSGNARQQKAANILLAGVQEAGEDPQKLIQFLNSKAVADAIKIANPTAAQATGSPLLTRLETSLAKVDPNYRRDIGVQGGLALDAYRALLKKLSDIGSPEAIQFAAEQEKDLFMKMVFDRINTAHETAAQKISRLKDPAKSSVDLGRIVKEEVLGALGDARDFEKQLWLNASRDAYRISKTGEAIPKSVRPSATIESFLYTLDSMSPERFASDFSAKLSPIARRFGYEDKFYQNFLNGKRTEEYVRTGRVPERFISTPTKKTATVEDLVQTRSDLLDYARKASNAGDVNDARIYGDLAESILQDLSQLNTPGYQVARQYSRDLNDMFNRAYPGEMLAKTGRGAERVPAEVLVGKAFGGNADLTAMRMLQVEDAVGFMRKQYDDIIADTNIPARQKNALLQQLEPYARIAEGRVASMTDAQGRILRLGAAEALDPTTNRINPKRLATFIENNRPLLQKMGVLSDLEDVQVAENLFRQVHSQYYADQTYQAFLNNPSQLNKKILDQQAFASILNKEEKPVLAIAEALSGKSPIASMGRLVKMAKNADKSAGNTNASDGLRSIIYDYAFTQAGSVANKFSPAAFEDVFFKSLVPGKNVTLAKILSDNGLFSFSEAKNLQRLIQPMKRVEAGLLRDSEVATLVGGADAVTDLALRIVGARIGTSLAPGGPGSLIAASAGSKTVRTIFDKMPRMSITKIIEDATRDPMLMRDLLTKGQTMTPSNRIQLAKRLNGYLVNAGYTAATFDPEELGLEVPTTPTTGPSAAQMLRQLPPAPPTKGVPGLQTQPPKGGQGAGAASPAAPGGAPTQSRVMFQSLFPMDTISPLLSQPR